MIDGRSSERCVERRSGQPNRHSTIKEEQFPVADIKIQAEERNEFGKGAARRIRRADKVPAVLYEHGATPLHVTLPGHALMLALKNSNALLSIDVAGKSHLAIPKQVQRDPIRGFIEHADMLMVKRGEKVIVDIPIHFSGDAEPGSLTQTELNSLSLEAEATHIPDRVEVSIEGLEIGTQVHVSDLELPKGTTLVSDGELLVLQITAAPTAEQIEAELAEAEAEAGIEHEATEADLEAEAEAEAEAAGDEGAPAQGGTDSE